MSRLSLKKQRSRTLREYSQFPIRFLLGAQTEEVYALGQQEPLWIIEEPPNAVEKEQARRLFQARKRRKRKIAKAIPRSTP